MPMETLEQLIPARAEPAVQSPRYGLLRVAIEEVRPELNGGLFPVKRIVGEDFEVEAHIHADGHDVLAAVLRYRHEGDGGWRETPMTLVEPGLDRWRGVFWLGRQGRYEYVPEAWVDHFASWREWLRRKHDAGEDVSSELLEGGRLLREAAARASPEDARLLAERAEELEDGGDPGRRASRALEPELSVVVSRYPDRSRSTTYGSVLGVVVDREKARLGAWYEMFPRSQVRGHIRGATFREAEARFPDIAGMGFDVLYLPPIHPIGRSYRKGPGGALAAGPDDPGSPWAIGSEEGGYTAVHPGLGTLEDFDHFLSEARRHGLELALDLALQCSPDHPYVREHPEWFRLRPDGTIKYAENPPKRYQDIYPLNFECEAWRSLWEEVSRVVRFWVDRGVRIFRVDNPHTKPYRFWQWLISGVKSDHPDVLFLAEAFTRPRVMAYLSKLGFSQSYTYFTWRNAKAELMDYFDELVRPPMSEHFRPNLFTNTPDILHAYLQTGGRAAFQARLVLAATLSPSYGIYSGFELCENEAVPGTEEYLDSEKFRVKPRDWDGPGNIKALIARVNAIRRQNPALAAFTNLRFLPSDSDHVLFYCKATPDRSNILLVAVNLDPFFTREAMVRVPCPDLGLPAGGFRVVDLLDGAAYRWTDHNYVRLDPAVAPAHILRVERG